MCGKPDLTANARSTSPFYYVLVFASPLQRLDIGILLYIPSEDQLLLKFRNDWNTVISDDLEILELLASDLEQKAQELGPRALLAYLEDTLSNTIQLSERLDIEITETPVITVSELFERIIGN